MQTRAALLIAVAACAGPRPAEPSSVAVAPMIDAASAGAAIDAGTVDAALAAGVPTAPRANDWLDVATVIPDAVIDLRYAGDRNLTGAPLYPRDARCLLRRSVAARLARAAAALRARDRRLVLWDCYRPHAVQFALWRALPDAAHVAPPTRDPDGAPRAGSDHSRGGAVDVSLADRAGAILPMPTDHDDPTPASARAAARDRSAQARLLDDVMVAAGFHPLASEWWHFAAPDAGRFALTDGWPAPTP
jgi:D-alanyl-D-alanine dipeptidase